MKYIICFLFFFGASCISTRKHHAAAQKIVDWAQTTIDSLHVKADFSKGQIVDTNTVVYSIKDWRRMVDSASCRHIWVAVEKDTVRGNSIYWIERIDTIRVYGSYLICLKCFGRRRQVIEYPYWQIQRLNDSASILLNRKKQ